MPRFRPKLAATTTVAIVAAAIAATVVAGPAAGKQPSRPPATIMTARAAADAPLTFTLITGDKVIARRDSGGGLSTEVRPGPGRAGMLFQKLALGNKDEVLPFDAIPLVSSGVVDERLFDIKLLADLHLDDASARTFPLLVQQPTRKHAAFPDGTTIARDLPLVHAVALNQDHRTTNLLWKTWIANPHALTKVWLDGGMKPMLDRSVRQIGAPVAWKSGITGKGVKVAVLDSGYDATHPDLKGRVIATKGFVDGADSTKDEVGHGTHVASTIAGSGAASGGKYRGVAPDAELMIGKVCDESCRDSDIIAGLQWAASEGARVVNLSLGGYSSGDTDPVSQAVDELTRSTGTLFVAAAGNAGADGTVASPAAADSALAVASVTKSDTLSTFSSRGPRTGDLAVKPDIAAPGDRIVAARAAGTLDQFAVNASYAELSGTSMASPHVAGAAALLAQLHPTWKAAELKAALMNSALGLKDLGVFAEGAGRVDVARAVRQSVIASPASVNLGLQTYPHTDDKPVTKSVAYNNDGATPVRLTLSLQVKGPDGNAGDVLKLARRSIDVPAHGTASVDVTADTSKPGPDGAYGGVLVATGNGMAIRTTVGVGKEVASDEHKVVVLDRSGQPVVNTEDLFAGAWITNVDTQEVFAVEPGDTVRLPHGHYVVNGLIGKANPGGVGYAEGTSLAEPDLVLDRAGDLVLDGRKAVKVAVKPPVAGATPAVEAIGFLRPLGPGTYTGGIAVINPLTTEFSPDLYVVPNTTGTVRTFTGFAQAVWAKMPPNQPPDHDFYLDSPYLYHDVSVWPGRVPPKPSLSTAQADYAHLDASYAGEPERQASNYGYPSLPGFDSGGHVRGLFLFTPTVEMNLPFRRQEYYAAKGVSWGFETDVWRKLSDDGMIQDLALVDSVAARYPAGRTTPIRWQQAVFGPSLPDSRAGWPGRTSMPWVFRDGDSLTVAVPMYSDGGNGRRGDAVIDSEHTSLSRDGVEVGASDAEVQQTFTLPADDARYTLTKTIRRSPEYFALSTEIESAWTFRSRRTPDGTASPLPLMNVRYEPTLDDHNRAPAGRFQVPVTVQYQYGIRPHPVTSLTIEASYDGTTWHTLPIRRAGSGWIAETNQPGGGFVSLRAHAVDSVGNEVAQTIHRAYEVK